MQTLNIRIPQLEMEMLVQIQKKNQKFKDLPKILIDQIRNEYYRQFPPGK